MLVAGLLLAGYAVAIVCWPQVLHWTVAGALGAVGLVLVVSAILARGNRNAGGPGNPAPNEPKG